MSLTDRERRQLASIERHLAGEDARLARRLSTVGWLQLLRWGPARLRLGAVGVVLGLAAGVAMMAAGAVIRISPVATMAVCLLVLMVVSAGAEVVDRIIVLHRRWHRSLDG